MDIYIIDTSSLIEMKNKYPQDVFPTVWQRMDELYRAGRLIAPLKVKEEIKDDELIEWLKNKEKIFIKSDKEQCDIVKEILKNFPYLAKPEKPDAPNADPWIIALALELKKEEQEKLLPENEYIIITEESKTKPNKIPGVCNHYDIKCINLLELFKEERWKF